MAQLLLIVSLSVTCGSLILLLSIYLIVRHVRGGRAPLEGQQQVFDEERKETEAEKGRGLLEHDDDPFASLPSTPRRFSHASLPTLIISAPPDDSPPTRPTASATLHIHANAIAFTHGRTSPITPSPNFHERTDSDPATSSSSSSITTISSQRVRRPSFFHRLFHTSRSSTPSPSLSAFPRPPSAPNSTENRARPSTEALLPSPSPIGLFHQHQHQHQHRTRGSISTLSSFTLGSIAESEDTAQLETAFHLDEYGMYFDRSQESDEEGEMRADEDWPLVLEGEGDTFGVATTPTTPISPGEGSGVGESPVDPMLSPKSERKGRSVARWSRDGGALAASRASEEEGGGG